MLQISNLSFAYQSEVIFEKVSFVLPDEGVVVIIGDNGTGKTTLLRLLAGELRPDNGAIKIRGRVAILHQTQDDLEDLSGGEQTRLRLAELFRERPDILLLDEPTNNLDTEAKSWLLANLYRYHGLVVIVSHDRDFINQVAEKILYLHDGEIEVFGGDYTDFQERQEQIRREQTLQYEQVQRTKKKLAMQLKIAKDRAHKSNRRAYNKIDNESKLHYNGQRMAAQNCAGKILKATQSKLEQLRSIPRPSEQKTYLANISANFLHQKKLLEVDGLAKSFGNKELFSDLSFEIWTSERIRVTGRNGSGKSTLFKIICGEMSEDSGSVWFAPGVKIEYIAQDKIGLSLEASFLEQCPDLDTTEVYRAAATMDFLPEDMRRPARELSRGQLTKLAILKLMIQPVDLLVLDEITNHLDIRARENIEKALQNYPGAILIATHDEAFANKIKIEREIKL